MVIVDADHPDIEDYIDWKVVEEQKVAALVAGSKLAAKHLNLIMAACREEAEDPFDPAKNPALKREIRAARRAMIPENYVQRVIQFARQGFAQIDFRTYDTDWDSEAYLTVAGQNSNNSVRLANDFLERVEIGRRLAPDPPHRRQDHQDPAGPRAVGQDRACRLGLGRSRAAVRHHDQRLAHLPGKRPDQRLEPVLGVHVPRRHGVQSGVVEPADLPPGGRQLRGRRLPARGAAVDAGAGDLGADGAVPVEGDRAAQLRLPHLGARLCQSRRPLDGRRHRL